MSHTERVLEMLERRGPKGAYGWELQHHSVGSWRFGAVIYDLRKGGYAIKSERVSGRNWKYTLLDSEEAPQ